MDDEDELAPINSTRAIDFKCDFPDRVTRAEIQLAQGTDKLLNTLLSAYLAGKSHVWAEVVGVLVHLHPDDLFHTQTVVHESLQPRSLNLAHQPRPPGHLGQRRMFQKLHNLFYWPQMTTDIAATVRKCPQCAKSGVRLHKHANKLQLFPATEPL